MRMRTLVGVAVLAAAALCALSGCALPGGAAKTAATSASPTAVVPNGYAPLPGSSGAPSPLPETCGLVLTKAQSQAVFGSGLLLGEHHGAYAAPASIGRTGRIGCMFERSAVGGSGTAAGLSAQRRPSPR